jgi:predicted  nucleic acid-binding Zn-ribbon protein
MTFKCSCGNVFKKITTNVNLKNPACPECKKKNKITKFHRLGDGPIPTTETKAEVSDTPRVFPNTIYKCNECFVVVKVFEDVGEVVVTECPACGSKDIKFRGKITHEISSDSAIRNKAVDVTADIVMQDYKMGDLKDNVRMGESMAPKLDPRLQVSADNMFGKKNNRKMPFNAGAMAKRAMSGGLRDPRSYVDPVSALQPQFKPKVEIVAGDKR